MARCRFVLPETTTIQLTDGDWIEVKKRLMNGERRTILVSLVGTRTDEGLKPDKETMGMAEVAAYLVDWSLVGPDGRRVSIDTEGKKYAALRALDPDDYDEIETAIDAHKAAMARERAALKNSKDGKPESSATLPSVG